MKTVGETLKATREEKGLDLELVSDTLKIRVKYLTALENADYSIFSSPLYIKGFIKNYAKYLGLDEETMLALFRRDYDGKTAARDLHSFILQKPVISNFKFVLKPTHVFIAITTAIIAIIAFYLIYELRVFSLPPTLQVSSPTQNEVVNVATILVTGNTDIGDKVSINGVPVPYITNTGGFSLNVTLHSGLNQLGITTTNTLNKSMTVNRNVIYDNASLNVSTTTTPTQQQNTMQARLTISTDNTYVKITTDGKAYFAGVLAPGTIKTFTAQSEIVIDTGRAEDTNLSVNGQNITFSGQGFVEHDITLNQSGLVTVQ